MNPTDKDGPAKLGKRTGVKIVRSSIISLRVTAYIPSELSASPTSDSRGAPPHISFPIAYSRRIEGLLEDAPKTVLQDLTPLTKQNPIATLSHGLERVLFKYELSLFLASFVNASRQSWRTLATRS